MKNLIKKPNGDEIMKKSQILHLHQFKQDMKVQLGPQLIRI